MLLILVSGQIGFIAKSRRLRMDNPTMIKGLYKAYFLILYNQLPCKKNSPDTEMYLSKPVSLGRS